MMALLDDTWRALVSLKLTLGAVQVYLSMNL